MPEELEPTINEAAAETAAENTTDQTAVTEAVAEEQEAVEVEEAVAETDADATVAETAEAEADIEAIPTKESTSIPEFRAGDTLRLGVRITEGDKTRIQYFEGMVLAKKGAGVSRSFTIRKIGAGGIAVERIFPINCPSIASYEVRRRGVVRRAKIYFLRDIVGSTANVIKERKIAKEMAQVQEARSAKRAAKAEKKASKKATPKPVPTHKPATRSARRQATKSS